MFICAMSAAFVTFFGSTCKFLKLALATGTASSADPITAINIRERPENEPMDR
jgi:hypothetical protein